MISDHIAIHKLGPSPIITALVTRSFLPHKSEMDRNNTHLDSLPFFTLVLAFMIFPLLGCRLIYKQRISIVVQHNPSSIVLFKEVPSVQIIPPRLRGNVHGRPWNKEQFCVSNFGLRCSTFRANIPSRATDRYVLNIRSSTRLELQLEHKFETWLR